MQLSMFATGPDSSINSWESWLFLTCENKQQSVMWINHLGINNCKVHYENCSVLYSQECRIMACTRTYLNSRLLGAPCECVLHGLDPGLDWASFWPSTSRVFHVAMPHLVSCCSSQMGRVSLLTLSLLSGWLLTNVQVNNTKTLYDTHGHTYVYTSHLHY
jgi:hypothetical protein